MDNLSSFNIKLTSGAHWTAHPDENGQEMVVVVSLRYKYGVNGRVTGALPGVKFPIEACELRLIIARLLKTMRSALSTQR